MKKTIVLCAVLIGSIASAPNARAIGCLSGGAAGAMAGHMAGHGILGALTGCIAGHQWHKHQLNKESLQNTSSYDQQRLNADPSYKSPWQQQRQ